MQGCYTKLGKVLTIAERRLVERWKAEGHSHRQIAGLLGKVPQTINTHLKSKIDEVHSLSTIDHRLVLGFEYCFNFQLGLG